MQDEAASEAQPPEAVAVDGLRVQRRGGLLCLTLDRPGRRNALNGPLVRALLREVEGVALDPAVQVILLGAVGPHFCSGADLGGDSPQGEGFFAQHADRAIFARLLQRIVESPVPVVGAVGGDALGGGAGLALACQLLVMAEGARLHTPELKLGLFPWMIAPVLARKLPRNLLHELILCGGRLDAPRALALGIANRVAPAEAVTEAALELARAVEAHSPLVVRMGMQALAQVDGLPLSAALAHMHAQLSLNLLTEDAAEGISAFASKRSPTWKGR
jgi:enoyl-CoA hydratase